MILYCVVNAPTARYRLASKKNIFFLNCFDYKMRILNTCQMNTEYLPVSQLCENESLSRGYIAISSHFCCIADITKLTVGLDGYAKFPYFLFQSHLYCPFFLDLKKHFSLFLAMKIKNNCVTDITRYGGIQN